MHIVSSRPYSQLEKFTFLLANVRTAKLVVGVDVRFDAQFAIGKMFREIPREMN